MILFITACGHPQNKSPMKPLTTEEKYVIEQKGTEKPFTGKYNNFYEQGIYVCRKCGAKLYRSTDKFKSECGWPSFDDEISSAIKRLPDADGKRIEIQCATCNAHLGHLFTGEYFTAKNTRHCVNSISLVFVPYKISQKQDTAYFASGCFWGTEYYFMKAQGVIQTNVGFMGGHKKNPTYKEVCSGNTGHIETTQVIYNSQETSYETLVKLFFETHDFIQADGQGPDIGEQYLSVLFYNNNIEEEIDQQYIKKLQNMGYAVATQLRPITHFWKAENYHQQYYEYNGGTPYCHKYKKIFE
ncbi:MAG: bifunctional methionine sulfoxide reductase B/A protein [Chitinophagaceae bacterium]